MSGEKEIGKRTGASEKLTQIELQTPKFENLSQLRSKFLLYQRILCAILLVLLMAPVQLIFLLFRLPFAIGFPRLFHKALLFLIGIEVERCGDVYKHSSAQTGALYVANHVSYFDIPILGALITGSFVSKAEVGTWPVFGWLAKMQRTLMIDRVPKNAAIHAAEIERRLASGGNLLLFPEGTTGDGRSVLKFKSSLFSVAQFRPGNEPLIVQPVTIAYTHLDGMPMGRNFRYFYAWFGDQNLLSHACEALQMGKLKVRVTFHPVVTIEEFGRRQPMANHCFDCVSNTLARDLSGREI